MVGLEIAKLPKDTQPTPTIIWQTQLSSELSLKGHASKISFSLRYIFHSGWNFSVPGRRWCRGHFVKKIQRIMWCCIQMNKEWPVSKSKSVGNIYPAKLESGGNGFKSCFVQISTKHSSQPLTEYQFCFFSYFPRVTGNSFVKTLQKKKKVLVQIFLLYFFVFLNLTGSTPLQFLSFWPRLQ